MSTASRRIRGGSCPRRVGRFGALLAAAATLLLAPTAASAATISIAKLAAGPIAAGTHCNPNLTPQQLETDAARRTDFCLAFYTTGGDPARGDDMQQVVTRLPQGFMATADTSPNCDPALFMPDRGDPARCPADSQVGSVQAMVRVSFNGITIPQTVTGRVWNLKHTTNEVAVMGIELETKLGGVSLPHTKLLGRTILRPNPDVGLQTTISNQPRHANLGSLLGHHPIVIDGFFLRLWGSKEDHPSLKQSFALLGSDCTTDQVTRMTGTTYGGGTTHAESRYRLTGCDQVPFDINASFSTAERRPDVPTGAQIVVRVDQHRDPHFQGNLRRTVMTLPDGIVMGPQVATGDGGLPLCSAEQFGWDRLGRATCPAASKVADVSFISPLQANHFDGAAYLGEQPAEGELPQLFIEGGFGDAPDAPRVKLRGTMRVDEQGRIETTLDNLPQVAFEEFRLTFRSGPHAPLVTPRECGTTTGQMLAVPSSGRGDIVKPISLTIDEDCINPRTFTPNIEVIPGSPQAGARAPLTVITERPDRTDRITQIIHDLPAGIVSDLKLATECPVAQAAVFACPASSRVGTVVTHAGVGPAPAEVRGDVFLGERQGSDVAAVIISSPIEFGDVKLGRLNIPARVLLRPEDQGLKLIADVPTHFKGIPMNVRRVAVTLDREGFAMNPTGCDARPAIGTLTSEGGQVAPVVKWVQMGGCEALAFEPQLAFEIDGPTSVGSKPTMRIAIGMPEGGSNMKATVVKMPPGIASDLKQVTRGCTLEAWNAGTCGADAQIGTIGARLAITDEIVGGTLSMVKIPTETLPGIGMQLHGRFATRLLGSTSLDRETGQLTTMYPSVPDVPLVQLNLNIDGGPRSPLLTTKSLCADGTATMTGGFASQSGRLVERKPQIDCPPSVAAARASGGRVRVSGTVRKGFTVRVTPPSGTKVRATKFTLPAGVSVKKSWMTKKKRLRRTSGVAVRGKRTVQAVVSKSGRSRVTVKVPRNSLSRTRKADRRSRWTVTFRVVYTNGKRETIRVRVRR